MVMNTEYMSKDPFTNNNVSEPKILVGRKNPNKQTIKLTILFRWIKNRNVLQKDTLKYISRIR